MKRTATYRGYLSQYGRQILRKFGLGQTSCGAFREGDGVAEGGQPLGVVAGEAVGVQALEVVAPEFAIRLAVAKYVVGDNEDAVGDGDNGLLVAAVLDEPAVLGGEVGVTFPDGTAGTLDGPAQGAVGGSPLRWTGCRPRAKVRATEQMPWPRTIVRR